MQDNHRLTCHWTTPATAYFTGLGYCMEPHWCAKPPWRYLKGIWHLRTWFSGEHGGTGLTVDPMILEVFPSLVILWVCDHQHLNTRRQHCTWAFTPNAALLGCFISQLQCCINNCFSALFYMFTHAQRPCFSSPSHTSKPLLASLEISPNIWNDGVLQGSFKLTVKMRMCLPFGELPTLLGLVQFLHSSLFIKSMRFTDLGKANMSLFPWREACDALRKIN